MTFGRYDVVFISGLSDPQLGLDPRYALRASLIVIGLLSSVTSIALGGWDLRRWMLSGLGKDAERHLLQLSMSMCSVCIGWALFPYWLNGVFRAYLVGEPVYDLHFHFLMPTIWLGGGLWRLGSLGIVYVALTICPVLLLANLIVTIQRRTWKQGIVSAGCLLIPPAAVVLSPSYVAWLLH